MSKVDEYVFLARVAEQAERFEDMIDFLQKMLKEKGADVDSEERNLLSVAFKNLISSKRAACRTIAAIEQNPKYQKFGSALLGYKSNIESKLVQDCEMIIKIINENVLNKKTNDESKAFFVKMIGDYYRYIAENARGSLMEEVKKKALAAYSEADKIPLPACNPTRLGLALNFSVFHYEVMKNHKVACEMAEMALQEALDQIDNIGEEDFKDAKSIIELLKENVTLWKEEDPNNIEDL